MNILTILCAVFILGFSVFCIKRNGMKGFLFVLSLLLLSLVGFIADFVGGYGQIVAICLALGIILCLLIKSKKSKIK